MVGKKMSMPYSGVFAMMPASTTSSAPVDDGRTMNQAIHRCETDNERASAVAFPEIQSGVYRHFKGKMYEVIGVAPLVDSSDYFVIYRPLDDGKSLVIRLYSEFTGMVNRDGKVLPRFELVQGLSITAAKTLG
jgi:hypothetical protein